MTTIKNFFETGLKTGSEIESFNSQRKFFERCLEVLKDETERKKTNDEIAELTKLINQKEQELALVIFPGFKNDLLEKIILEDPSLKDFVNSNCSSVVKRSVGEEFTSILGTIFFSKSMDKTTTWSCFDSSDFDKMDLNSCKFLALKFGKIVSKYYPITLTIKLFKIEDIKQKPYMFNFSWTK